MNMVLFDNFSCTALLGSGEATRHSVKSSICATRAFRTNWYQLNGSIDVRWWLSYLLIDDFLGVIDRMTERWRKKRGISQPNELKISSVNMIYWHSCTCQSEWLSSWVLGSIHLWFSVTVPIAFLPEYLKKEHAERGIDKNGTWFFPHTLICIMMKVW